MYLWFHTRVCTYGSTLGGGNKDARDMRNIEMERRLRKGENMTATWKEPGGFEKYTKVSSVYS